mgnify:FL=1
MAEKKVTDMDSTELKGELLELRKEQFNLRVQRGTGQLTNSSRFKVVRRQIARIKTQMSEINRITS